MNQYLLIVTIDEKEYLRLGLLLEQLFPDAALEMVSSVVNPRGRHRPGRFARSEEYIFVAMLGRAMVGQELDPDFGEGSNLPWRTLRRSDAASARGTAKGGPAQFYRRVESVAEAMGRLRVLDLTDEKVREAVAAAKDAAGLFSGALARDY